ncbi:thioredoxin-like protein [Rickenella mellea]|uniref:Thioredoxin-like protein n=1 Tax=Rickenella mellea TaxID=50990 RepID=A0A4R5XEF3_9AGAM|nr:thioredoxin-like protein [Rickenella mellea]
MVEDIEKEYNESLHEGTASASITSDPHESTSDDDEFSKLENEMDNDFDLGALREKRMEELKREMARAKDLQKQDHGRVSEMTNEKEVIHMSAKEKRCVIHFYHRDFRRCAIMNKHLDVIAPKYLGTKFIRVLVENVPWLVEKLSIQVLPCVVCFVDGVSKDRLIGFEELGNDDAFDTATLELRLQLSGVVEKQSTIPLRSMYTDSMSSAARSGIRSRTDDSDLDDD